MRNYGRRLHGLLLIQPGEAGKVAYFLLFFLLVSTGMAIGSGTAHALFLKRVGIEYLPLMYMAQSVVLALVSLCYAAVADRLPAERIFLVLFVVLLGLVSACWLLIQVSGVPAVFPLYYLVYDVASEVLLVHTALYLNQNMNTLQAKRLAPLIYAGAQAGNIAGGVLLATATPFVGAENMLLAWNLLLATSVLALYLWHRRHGTSSHYRAPRRSGRWIAESVGQVRQGIRYTLTSTLLRAASLALFFMVISYYVMWYSVNRIYNHSFPVEAELAGFFGTVTAVTGLIALFLQLFVAGRAIGYFGIRRMNLLIPATTIFVLSALSFSYTLPVALAGSLNKDALMPAFRNPIRTMFFNVLPAHVQGRARALSVAIVLPAAMMICGCLLWFMQRTGSPIVFLVPGIVAAVLYAWFNMRMGQAYTGTLVSTLRERLFLPDDRLYRDVGGAGDAVFDEIRRGAGHADPEVAICFARVLVESFPEPAADIVLERAERADVPTADRLLKLLADADLAGQESRLGKLIAGGDAHLRASIIRLTADMPLPSLHTEALQLLDDPNPRLSAAAVHLALHRGDSAAATEAWRRLLRGGRQSALAVLSLVEDIPRLPASGRTDVEAGMLGLFPRLLREGPDEVRAAVFAGLRHWPCPASPELQGLIAGYLENDNPRLRYTATRCLHLLAPDRRTRLLQQALGDGHALVRQAAVDCLQATETDLPALIPAWLGDNRISLRAQQVLLGTEQAAALPPAVLSEIAIAKAHDADRLLQAMQRLGSGAGSGTTAYGRLLEHLLRERFDATVQLALQAMEPLYEPGLIAVIRAGFSSADERHIANAGEALSSLVHCRAAGLLNDVLRRSREQYRAQEGGFSRVVDVLHWCASLPDEWLQACATRVLQESDPETSYA